MLENLEFVIGDPEHLRGRAIIYTENLSGSENPFNPRFPALAVAADPSELLALLSSIAPFPDSIKETILDKIRDAAGTWSRTMFGQPMYRFVRDMLDKGLDQIDLPDDMKAQMREEMENIPDEEIGVPFHGAFIPLVGFDPDAIQPFESKCDVAKARDVPSVTYAGLVLTGYAQHYLASLLMQSEEEGAREVEETGEDAMPNARDMSPAAFLDLLNRKVSELMYARETGAPLEDKILELRRLTAGTVFIRDVLNLARFSETQHPRKVEILDLYLKRISLLAQERYEEIPALDQELSALMAS
jgi:hypothetical protein